MLSLTIQTLGPNPRIHTTNGVFRRRIASFPATLLSFSGDSGSPTVHSSCIREIRSKFRAIRATGGSNQVDDGGNYNAENTIHTNVVSWAQALLEFTEINFLPIGLAIFCCMPTTLSSGVALTNLVGGNSALALAMTVISNLLGIIFVPVSLSKFIGAGAGVSIPTMELFYSLVSTLLVPLILGKVLRDAFKGLAEYVDQNRQLFSMINSTLLSLVPWMQVSRSRPLFLTVTPTAFAVAISAGILLHLVLLAFNTIAITALSASSGGKESAFAQKENSRAVILVASQKTLPVMVAVVEQLKGALGEPGLLVLPCVAAHINQIIIDSFLVNWWLRKDQETMKPKEI